MEADETPVAAVAQPEVAVRAPVVDAVAPQVAAPVVPPPIAMPAQQALPLQDTAPQAPAVALSRAMAAPLPLEQLLPVLQSAGMTLAQTNAEKLAQVQARIAAEPRAPHVPRERAVLPPLDQGPLVQVETRHSSAPPVA